MSGKLRYADVYEGVQAGTVEARPYTLSGYTSRVGRSSADAYCPFCERVTEVFLWSLAGGGKRCECGALFGRGEAYARQAVSR